MKILITGVAGFIGMHVASYFLKNNHEVVGIDNINDYYEISLKKARLKQLQNFQESFKFYKADISNYKKLINIFKKHIFLKNYLNTRIYNYIINNIELNIKINTVRKVRFLIGLMTPFQRTQFINKFILIDNI